MSCNYLGIILINVLYSFSKALVATGFDQTKWHCRGAVHHLLQSQQLDGSFGYGTIDETSAVLLALAGKHIGALAYADIECPDGMAIFSQVIC